MLSTPFIFIIHSYVYVSHIRLYSHNVNLKEMSISDYYSPFFGTAEKMREETILNILKIFKNLHSVTTNTFQKSFVTFSN